MTNQEVGKSLKKRRTYIISTDQKMMYCEDTNERFPVDHDNERYLEYLGEAGGLADFGDVPGWRCD